MSLITSPSACDTRVALSMSGVLLMVALATAGCTPSSEHATMTGPTDRGPAPSEEGAYFVDVTEYVGVDIVHSIGDGDLSNIVETVGSGAAFLDYDQDGWMDVYIANNTFMESVSSGERPSQLPRNRLYRNHEGAYFEDVTHRAGVADEKGFGMGVAVADYDNDGYPDILQCNYGPNVLFRNNGDGTFTDVAKKAGLRGDANTVGAVWLDFDNDGHLDLYVGNYLEYDAEYTSYYAPDAFPPPTSYAGQPDVLYRNRGDGTFADVTKEMGLYRPEGRMMGVAAADYDRDGYVDIYVANDAMANYLFRNDLGRRFDDVSYRSGVAFSEGGEETSSMAVDFADYDGDGRPDLFVSDIHFSALYRNEGGGLFSDVTVPSGIAAFSGQYDGWGSSFMDYDNDGDVDIFKVNGDLNHLFGHEDQLFENQGDGSFLDVSIESGRHFQSEWVSRGAAFGDYDNDGDVDVLIVNLNERAVLLRNENLQGNHWITVALAGSESNRDGVGALVEVTAGGKVQSAPKESAGGYLSTNDPRMHFGLGKAEIVDRIEIRWPSGTVQVLENIPINQFVRIEEEPSGSAVTDSGGTW
ncbi:MAG: CRTAC1 family protein [Rhodothermales bacterium]